MTTNSTPSTTLDGNNVVRHAELVSAIENEPNYDAALAALRAC